MSAFDMNSKPILSADDLDDEAFDELNLKHHIAVHASSKLLFGDIFQLEDGELGMEFQVIPISIGNEMHTEIHFEFPYENGLFATIMEQIYICNAHIFGQELSQSPDRDEVIKKRPLAFEYLVPDSEFSVEVLAGPDEPTFEGLLVPKKGRIVH